jgi:hypothetical protein
MGNSFEVPARPWGEKEIKFLRAHEALLDNDLRAELGLKVSEDAPEETPVATPSEGGEESAPESGQEVEEVLPNTDGTGPVDPEQVPEVTNDVSGDAAATAAMEAGNEAAEAAVNTETEQTA